MSVAASPSAFLSQCDRSAQPHIFAACCGTFFALAALVCAAQPNAGHYPAKPIRLLVPQPPSGTADMLARMIGQKLAEAVGQPFVIDNRPGASGTMGTDMVAKAPADGYTILLTYSTHSTTPSLYKKLPYDPVRDFAPITIATSAPLMLVVNPAVPVHTVKDLIALAKAKPNALNFGSAGNGSGSHLAGELLKTMTGIKATHVPYKGTGAAIIALLANEVQFMFAGLLPAQVQVKANRLRAIAITSPKRSSFIPDLPTVEESGLPGFEVVGWYGVLAPAGTPPAIVDRLNAEIVRILALPDVKARIAGAGAEVVGDSPAHFEAFLKTDIARWAKLIKASGAHID
jgi:tripartite-type tricarboxylate transporter receptor subunit TctC